VVGGMPKSSCGVPQGLAPLDSGGRGVPAAEQDASPQPCSPQSRRAAERGRAPWQGQLVEPHVYHVPVVP